MKKFNAWGSAPAPSEGFENPQSGACVILVQGETEKTPEAGSLIYETMCGAETLFQSEKEKGLLETALEQGWGNGGTGL